MKFKVLYSGTEIAEHEMSKKEFEKYKEELKKGLPGTEIVEIKDVKDKK